MLRESVPAKVQFFQHFASPFTIKLIFSAGAIGTVFVRDLTVIHDFDFIKSQYL